MFEKWIKSLMVVLAIAVIASVATGAVTTNFTYPKTKDGMPTYALGPCSHVDARVLTAAGGAESHTVPANANYVVFNCVDSSGNAASFYANFSGTAAIPAADITDGSGSELNPTVRYVSAGSTISMIVPADAIVVMNFYK